MIKTTLGELAKQLNGSSITQDIAITGISIDTRTISPHALFIALTGHRLDGHDFIEEAIRKNANAILVNRQLNLPIPQLIVADTLAALGKIAANWRNRFMIPFIGITGSNGKTTLKNMVASILRTACQRDDAVLATEGNLNNNIGVPLMLSRLNEQHRYAVIEMGMNHFGEILYLTQLVKPHIAIINNAAAAHLEGLNDVSGVARAKGEIFSGLDANGIAILNRDDAFYDYWYSITSHHHHLTFGLNHSADITASGTNIHTPNGNISVTLPLLGKHNLMNALAATATAIALNIDLDAIKIGLENVKPAHGRLEQYSLSNGALLIDDSYNANPASVSAAINTLAALSGTRIFILGDMKELGKDAAAFHFNMGKEAKNAGIHYLFTVGELSQAAAEGFGQTAQHFKTHDDLLFHVKNYLNDNTTILIKGSRSMRMETIVSGLL